jgi:hypothetical protein
VCLLVIALARGIAALAAVIAERRRNDPPSGPNTDDLVLAA